MFLLHLWQFADICLHLIVIYPRAGRTQRKPSRKDRFAFLDSIAPFLSVCCIVPVFLHFGLVLFETHV
jgi:hypothetical protein